MQQKASIFVAQDEDQQSQARAGGGREPPIFETIRKQEQKKNEALEKERLRLEHLKKVQEKKIQL